MKISRSHYRKIKNYKWIISTIAPKLGHKDEPYYKTEKEMLTDPVYNYESLSISEKQLYDEPRSNKPILLQRKRKQ